ncbi:MAG: phage tail assembly protein [Planctomycetes bacterium]|nr:phage tail assembly protein [Planctomycetota bacterium]
MTNDTTAAGEYTFTLPKGYMDEKGQVHREVTLREITGADQEAMLNPQLKSNPAKMLSALLARVITHLGTLESKDIGTHVTGRMLKSDRDFLILKLKEIDGGPEMDIDVECPSCSHKFKATFDISDFFAR